MQHPFALLCPARERPHDHTLLARKPLGRSSMFHDFVQLRCRSCVAISAIDDLTPAGILSGYIPDVSRPILVFDATPWLLVSLLYFPALSSYHSISIIIGG